MLQMLVTGQSHVINIWEARDSSQAYLPLLPPAFSALCVPCGRGRVVIGRMSVFPFHRLRHGFLGKLNVSPEDLALGLLTLVYMLVQSHTSYLQRELWSPGLLRPNPELPTSRKGGWKDRQLLSPIHNRKGGSRSYVPLQPYLYPSLFMQGPYLEL